MDDVVLYVKTSVSFVVAVFLNAMGGFDSLLHLLVALICTDFVTGVIYAVMNKCLNSKAMRDGLMKKGVIFLLIYIALRLDVFLQQYLSMNFCARTFVIVYASIEELISLLENINNIGFPIPKWLRGILSQAMDYIDTSLPDVIVKFLKSKFGNIDINEVLESNPKDKHNGKSKNKNPPSEDEEKGENK